MSVSSVLVIVRALSVYVQTCIYSCVRTCTQKNMRTCIHIHEHTQTNTNPPSYTLPLTPYTHTHPHTHVRTYRPALSNAQSESIKAGQNVSSHPADPDPAFSARLFSNAGFGRVSVVLPSDVYPCIG